MPKRIVDGDAVWTSNRIRAVMPLTFRPEYANLIPLALANGVFECDPFLVWTKVYSYNRPDISCDMARTILGEFERVGLLFRWSERAAKEWGFWVGIDKTGRLPPPTQRERMERGPEPPAKGLREYMHRTADPTVVLGQSYLGLVGFGMGGEGKSNAPPTPHKNGGGNHSPSVRLRTKTEIVFCGGEQIKVVYPSKLKRLWTQTEAETMVGSRADDWVEFFKRRGYDAKIVRTQ